MAVTVPPDRRFLRAQVKPGRRQSHWRRRLKLLRTAAVVLAGVWLVWRGGVLVAGSSLLDVRDIRIAGNSRLSRGEALAMLDGLRGQNILSARLEDWRQHLLDSPWVAEASIRRSLPSTVEVTIVERRPLAIARVGADLYLVDERGAIIDEWGPRYQDLDLPILDGLGLRGRTSAGEDEQRAGLASRLLEDVRQRPALARRISQVDVSDPHDAVVIVDQDTARLRLGDDGFLKRLESYLELAPALREHVPEIDYVDLRFGDRVYVGSLGAARRPVTGRAARAASSPAVRQ